MLICTEYKIISGPSVRTVLLCRKLRQRAQYTYTTIIFSLAYITLTYVLGPKGRVM